MSVDVEPTASISELLSAESTVVQKLPTDVPESVSTPLLLPVTSPRSSRFTVPLPSGGSRGRQSPRVRREGAVAPRRREPEQVPVSGGGVSLTRSGESTTSGSKETSRSSDLGSSEKNGTAGVEPPASTSATDTAPATAEYYVEFGRPTTAETVAVEVSDAAAAVPEVASEPPVAGTAEPVSHEYCYTTETAPDIELSTSLEVEAVVQESPPLPPPSSTPSSRRGLSWPGREHPRPPPEGSTEPTPAPAARPRCLYCDEPFEPASNRRGACPDAPDAAADCIDRVSCLCCARAVVYHCLEPADDVSPAVDDRDPCACDGGLGGVRRCRRWTALSVLSVVVPCLCLYRPLVGCHRCAVRFGCCGGRHSASSHVVVV